MDPAKLAAFLAVAVVVCAVAAAPATADYYSGGGGGGGAPAPESCQTQITYFTNCLARSEIRGQCCSVVESRKCLCQLKREVALPCSLHRHHGRKCSKDEQAPPSVKLAELQRLPCFKTLKC
ncbi:hypothetical protein BDA96_02G089500 [Sorghum bicolor]|uniref:Bifunctional inhibitor/plant lipid transfer protein/seed storage helical domain-containing protein n=2 Tax=Sorghum bicolor TaxID=4558 RepID=A0A921RKU4_SORBI|nr:uncharacterized protein LOC8069143 [Sorghum bicolor]EER98248.1 hypothetical protein SORBI_3002G085900 [Sorghum bicolor]KAG0542279.1 hypothetical protein BDA96_02G089500 [Sorghum bicolor]|eukprot:XP_002461727.1 uncharacterized protein LOC8069143 [Sorghum bicolor]